MVVDKFFKGSALSSASLEAKASSLLSALRKKFDGLCDSLTIDCEYCYYVESSRSLQEPELVRLKWLLEDADSTSVFSNRSVTSLLIEIGPRLNFCTAWSTNAVSICHSCGLAIVTRIERAHRFVLTAKNNSSDVPIAGEAEELCVSLLHDRMTECRYVEPLSSFAISVSPEEVYDVDVMGHGRAALEEASARLGLSLDKWDIEYYTNMFRDRVGRNPTSVECFDLAQSNSEHSRHWFFKGRMVIDGQEKETSLLHMVIDTQKHSNQNNLIAFSDNSSAIKGHRLVAFQPKQVDRPSELCKVEQDRHIVFTAETHNFPTGVAPFPGATTGTGGRIRDVQATGRGAHTLAGTAGYCFGNLCLPGYDLPWEDRSFAYPNNFALPADVAVEASNGASDYGNKFGEPVLCGFARSFGLRLPGGERREWVKPIMFSGGLGSMDGRHIKKDKPSPDMLVVKLGGPVYRIGVGGGAASSVVVQGTQASDLDFGAVQRGDAEMEQKLQRAIRACVELGDRNPICSIHDQGAGGNGNVLKELVEPCGAVIDTSKFQLGDPTVSVLELWGAEYQESDALLIRAEDEGLLQSICDREKVPVCFVGKVSSDGRVIVEHRQLENGDGSKEVVTRPVDLELDWVLGQMPRKVFELKSVQQTHEPFTWPEKETLRGALERVLRLPSVASKRYLTNKVDRSVTGLVAQQQCVGPLHTPVADAAVVALSHFSDAGAATAIGEQPIKQLISPAAGARMAVAESLTNLAFVKITDLRDVKCSGNWMWPAKLPGEGAALYEACEAMCDIMGKVGIAVDGGKDSLSMAAHIREEGGSVKAPGALVISTYAPCPNINVKVTPDLKPVDGSCIALIRMSDRCRLGGSALAQVYKSLGSESPDVDSPQLLVNLFNTVQSILENGWLLAGHDVSDGGVITAILEMAFSGNVGLTLSLPMPQERCCEFLFAEEASVLVQVLVEEKDKVMAVCEKAGLLCDFLGTVGGQTIFIDVQNGTATSKILDESVAVLRDIWEATSFELELRQCNPKCVVEERVTLRERSTPSWQVTFDLDVAMPSSDRHLRVAIFREEGSNGDREMANAFVAAGFEVHDVTSLDLCRGNVSLNQFCGVAFVGGFSYADVLGSARGWAATLRYNEHACKELCAFRERTDTFSLGICNGCQLMAQLGWVGSDVQATQVKTGPASSASVRFTHNDSGRYESRFVNVIIQQTPAIMLQGMAGTSLGVWVGHGEGRLESDADTITALLDRQLAPVRYVDDNNTVTNTYPLNPNGSPFGIAGVCSADGRHLAMMPHPERTCHLYNWPYRPHGNSWSISPWLRMFQNARHWCEQFSWGL